jgi:large subunit ribosomal protein L24
MNRIRRGDTVQIISGKFKGAKGRVVAVFPEDDKVIIEGINVKKRHMKPNARMPRGGVVEREAPIPACKVMPIDPTTGLATRVRFKVDEAGKKVRAAVKSGAEIPANS